MNSKKANWLFLSVVISHIMLIIVLVVCSQFFTLGIIENLLVSQIMIVLPATLVLLTGNYQQPIWKELGFVKVKISTLCFTAIYTFLLLPLVTVVNAISMLFVENTVAVMSNEILALPFPVMLFLIAGVGPFCEELVFRGIIFSGYRKDGTIIGAAILSALVFGLMHMNFNQAGYAFVIGIGLALLVVATGSIWPAFFSHFLINAQSVCSMYLMEAVEPGSMELEAEALTKDTLLFMIGIYTIVAAVTTVLAGCLLVWLAGREGQKENLKKLWEKTEHTSKRITIPLIVGIVIAVLYMLFETWLMKISA